MLKPISYYNVLKFSSVKEMLDLANEQAGEKCAFVYVDKKQEKSVTYSEFIRTTEYICTALDDMGFGESFIANIGVNSYKWVCIYLAVLQGDGVYVPVDKELPFDDILNVVNESGSEVLFYAPKFEDIFIKNRDKFKNVKIFIGLERREDEGDFLSYDKLLKKGKFLFENGKRFKKKSGENDLKMLVYTSGTTGMSKGVMLTEHNLVSCVYYGLEVSRVYDRYLSILPYHHTYESVCGLLVAIHNHSTVFINDRLTNILKNLKRFKPDYICIVPAFAEMFYKKICESAREQRKEKSLKMLISVSNLLLKAGIDVRRRLFKSITDNFGGNLKKIVCGGAPVRPEVGKFFDSIGIYLVNGYGITECSPLVSANREENNDCTSVGIPLRCVNIRFADTDSDGNGEICVKGDTVMKGYYKNPELTKEVLSDDGWFKTGDFGRYNKNGNLVITGRKKNLIVLKNGKNVFPEEIEEYIGGIDYVKEVVVYSAKDKDGQEDGLCAEVFPDFDDERVKNCESIKQMLKDDINRVTSVLPVYKRIGTVKVRDKEFIKNSSNKIRRNLIEK